MAPAGIGGLFVRYRKYYLWGAFALIASNACSSSIPWLLKRGVDAIGRADPGAALVAAGQMIGLAIAQGIIRVISRILVFNGGRLIEYDLRNRILARLHDLGPSFYRRMPTGEIMSRATNDLTQVRLLFGPGVLNIANTLIIYSFALTLMAQTDGRLTLVSLLPYPLFLLIFRAFGKRLFSASRATQEVLGRMSDRVQESLAGVRVVRGFGLEAAEQNAFDRLGDEYLKRTLELVKVRGTMWPVMGAVTGIGTLIVLWYGGWRVVQGTFTLGEFVAFNGWLAMLAWPTLALGWVLNLVQRGRASYERIRAILDGIHPPPPAALRGREPPSPAPPPAEPSGPPLAGGSLGADVPARRPPVRHAGAIQVKDLGFSYNGARVLDGVSFVVPARGMVAIVGRTGSGKTTLAELLLRLQPTPPGRVFLDGRDVTELPLDELRGAVGYVPQDPFLFSTTIARNIAYALDDPDAEAALRRVRAAAAAAAIEEEINRFGDGFDTIVGERGVQLSGGQKQRVALARALVTEAPILLLDDPLSAVDARTEARILRTIAQQAGGRTIVLITHRVALADVERGFATAADKSQRSIKVTVAV